MRNDNYVNGRTKTMLIQSLEAERAILIGSVLPRADLEQTAAVYGYDIKEIGTAGNTIHLVKEWEQICNLAGILELVPYYLHGCIHDITYPQRYWLQALVAYGVKEQRTLEELYGLIKCSDKLTLYNLLTEQMGSGNPMWFQPIWRALDDIALIREAMLELFRHEETRNSLSKEDVRGEDIGMTKTVYLIKSCCGSKKIEGLIFRTLATSYCAWKMAGGQARAPLCVIADNASGMVMQERLVVERLKNIQYVIRINALRENQTDRQNAVCYI